VIIVSTTGEGDPPDNAQKLWRRLKKRTVSSDYLSQLNYALLGKNIASTPASHYRGLFRIPLLKAVFGGVMQQLVLLFLKNLK
jgi:hypothetical protein